jgi:hypothetical protein
LAPEEIERIQLKRRPEMKFLRFARHWIWLAPLALGVAFIAAGGYMVLEGRNAHNDVRDSIVQENITVAEDAPAFGGETVDSAGKADAQADAILKHTLTSTGGYLYAEMGRFLMPEGNYVLPKGTFMTTDGGTTQDITLAATDEAGNPVIVTTDEALAAKNGSDQPVRAWTSDSKLAATNAEGKPLDNPLRATAQTSAFLRTSLGVAVMGFKVSDLVVGVGAFMVAIGGVFVLVLAPAVYYSAELANNYSEIIRRQEAEKAKATPPVPAT